MLLLEHMAIRATRVPYPLVVGNGAPIPGFPRPVPEFSGTVRGWEHGIKKKHWGFFGDGVGLKIGVFLGFILENPRK